MYSRNKIKRSFAEKVCKSLDELTLGLLIKGIAFGAVGTALLTMGYSAEHKDILTNCMIALGYVTGVPGGLATICGGINFACNYKKQN